MMIKKIFFRLCLCSLLLVLPAIQAAWAQSTRQQTPDQVIRNMASDFEQAFVSQQQQIKAHPEMVKTLIQQYLMPQVNFALMSRYVLGRNWNKANPQQQQQFMRLFEQLLLHFYSKGFVEVAQKYHLTTGMVTFLPFHMKQNSKFARVKTRVKLHADKPAIKINYSLYLTQKSGWKIYDISVEGISLVTNYRASFNRLIQKGGITLLLENLQQKIDSFSKSS